MEKKNNFWLWNDRILAGSFMNQLLWAIVIFLLGLIVVATIYLCINIDRGLENVAQSFVDMTNPETVSREVYDGSEGQKTKDHLKIIGLALVYVIGTFLFSGLLVATITNGWRSRVDRFHRGTLKYKFGEHIVFLGYNSLVPEIIQKICEREPDARILVGVEQDASSVCDKIRNRLWNDFRKNVVVLQADSCNRKDLERLSVPYAKEVFIIGEHDDAYNLKCYRTVYELSLCQSPSKTRMPQCYVNLQSRSTLTLFRTYASAGELGVDFTCFHSFNFMDEWACSLIQKNGTINGMHQNIVIAGMTEMGISLAHEAVLLCHYPNTHTTITFIDNDAKLKTKRFISQYQYFFDHCKYRVMTNGEEFIHNPIEDGNMLDIDFEFIEGDLLDETVKSDISNNINNPNKLTIIAICHDDAQLNISMGLSLPDNVYGDDSYDEGKSNVLVWVYQPTLCDLGKYLKNSRYKNVVTFGMGMLGDTPLLDTMNERNAIAQGINHYLLHSNEGDVDCSDQRLIEMEWEERSISERWSCLRRATFLPILSQNNNDISVMAEMERKRSVAEKLLLGGLSLENGDNSMKAFEDYAKNINRIKNENYSSTLESMKTINLFIASSSISDDLNGQKKELVKLCRELNTNFAAEKINFVIKPIAYEDLERRMDVFESHIKNDDIVVFLIDKAPEPFLEEELKKAADSAHSKGKPELLVFVSEELDHDSKQRINETLKKGGWFYELLDDTNGFRTNVEKRIKGYVAQYQSRKQEKKRILMYFLLGLFVVTSFALGYIIYQYNEIKQLETKRLLIVGGGSVRKYIEEGLLKQKYGLSKKEHWLYAPMPSGDAYKIMAEEIIKSDSNYKNYKNRPYYPVILSALAEEETEDSLFTRTINRKTFAETGVVIGVHIGDDRLVAYGSNNAFDTSINIPTLKTIKPDSLTIEAKYFKSYIDSLKIDSISIYTTSENSGTLKAYQKVDKSIKQKNIFSDIDSISSKCEKWIALGSEYYKPCDKNMVKLTLVDSDSIKPVKLLYVYFMRYNDNDTYKLPNATEEFLKKIGCSSSDIDSIQKTNVSTTKVLYLYDNFKRDTFK